METRHLVIKIDLPNDGPRKITCATIFPETVMEINMNFPEISQFVAWLTKVLENHEQISEGTYPI